METFHLRRCAKGNSPVLVELAAGARVECVYQELKMLEASAMTRRPNKRAWTEEDTERLRVHIERGGSAMRAAVMFKRSEQAVRTHAHACGWKFPTINELRRRAAGPPVQQQGLS
jgi:hypothetical protein